MSIGRHTDEATSPYDHIDDDLSKENITIIRDSDDYRTVLTDNVGMVWVNQEKNAYTTDISRQNHKYLRKLENEYYKKQRLQKNK